MRKFLLAAIFFLLSLSAYPQEYCTANDFTPVLNTYDFFLVFGGNDGNSVKLDNRNLIGDMEFIAFPGTVFEIHEIADFSERGLKYFRVTTDEYKYDGNFWVDSRMVTTHFEKPMERKIQKPVKEDVLKYMKSLIGYPYMWGGNRAEGITEMLNFYKPNGEVNESTRNLWVLKGVDCSGLLYQTTEGYTPRNTSSLLNFGTAVDIEDKTVDEIIPVLQPLDLIVIKGHVVIILDENTTIESSPSVGVHTSDIKSRLEKIMKDYKPVNEFGKREWKNKEFVVRRWIE